MAKRLSTRLRESLNLTRNEAKIYLAALQLGSATMTEIAKKAKMARTSAYSVVEHLLESGYLLEFEQGKHAQYVAMPPDKLLSKVREQEEQLHDIIPDLRKLGEKNRVEPHIRTIPGDEGVRTVLREILEAKRPFRAITAITDMRLRLEDEFDAFIRKRVQQRLKVHLLTNRMPYTKKMKEQDGKCLRVTRFLPSDREIHTATYVFGDTVALIGIQSEPSVSVIIDDAAIAKTQALMFDLVWQTARS